MRTNKQLVWIIVCVTCYLFDHKVFFKQRLSFALLTSMCSRNVPMAKISPRTRGSFWLLFTRCNDARSFTCYLSPHGVTLWTKKQWKLALFVFALVFEVAVDFFRENWFLYKGRNDVALSKTWEFLTPVYLCLLVCNFAVKSAFVLNLLAIMFAIKVWCQFHPHSFYHSFNGNCTTFTKGVSHVGR